MGFTPPNFITRQEQREALRKIKEEKRALRAQGNLPPPVTNNQ
jgi:hypothetical protein